MKHLPGTKLTEHEALDWGKYVGVDEDGSARVFKKQPVKAGDTWIPNKFPDKMYPACYRLENDYPEYSGQLLVRKSKNGDTVYMSKS
jgi:hypothetical protein